MIFDVSTFFNSAILIFVVLSLGALAGFFCERIGIVNIAIDGQMIFGALIFSIFAMLLNKVFPNLAGFSFLIPILCSAVLSVLLSMLFGWMVIKLKLNNVVAGTAINLLTAGVATFLTQPIGTAISNSEYPMLLVKYIPTWNIANGFYGETILIVVIAALIIIASIILMKKTKFGLRFKAIGDNPNAVDAQGIKVNKYKWYGMIISGVLGAIAGSIFILGGATMYPQSAYFEGNVSGLGFLALAIVVSGAWKIPFITLSSFIFAFLMSATNIISDDPMLTNALGNYAKYIAKLIPFVISFVLLIIFSRKGFAPKALGKAFDRQLR